MKQVGNRIVRERGGKEGKMICPECKVECIYLGFAHGDIRLWGCPQCRVVYWDIERRTKDELDLLEVR